jgi:hypothetical protein
MGFEAIKARSPELSIDKFPLVCETLMSFTVPSL